MKCPFCKSENIRVAGAAAYDDAAYTLYTCMDCHRDFSVKRDTAKDKVPFTSAPHEPSAGNMADGQIDGATVKPGKG
jgi:transposase-like protein